MSAKVEHTNIPAEGKILLREQAGRLYLWGEGFGDGKLDAILKQSSSLEVTVIRFLAIVGRKLLDCKFMNLYLYY